MPLVNYHRKSILIQGENLAWCAQEESENLRKIIFQRVNEISVDSTECLLTLSEQSSPPKRSVLFNFMASQGRSYQE